jgi:hypothetical protein
MPVLKNGTYEPTSAELKKFIEDRKSDIYFILSRYRSEYVLNQVLRTSKEDPSLGRPEKLLVDGDPDRAGWAFGDLEENKIFLQAALKRLDPDYEKGTALHYRISLTYASLEPLEELTNEVYSWIWGDDVKGIECFPPMFGSQAKCHDNFRNRVVDAMEMVLNNEKALWEQ